MEKDSEILFLALSMRKCYIETGDPFYTAADVEFYNSHVTKRDKIKEIKALNINQKKLLIRIEELMGKAITNKIFVKE